MDCSSNEICRPAIYSRREVIEGETFSTFYLYKEHKELYCSNPSSLFLHYKNYRIDLLTGEREDYDITTFITSLEKYRCTDFIESPVVIHLFFELGYLCTDQIDLIEDGTPLAIICHYTEALKKNLAGIKPYSKCNFIPLSTPSKKEYKKKFNIVYEHLLRGDCYQVNLTMPTIFRLDKNLRPKEFIRTVWNEPMKISAYAHATYIHSLDHLLLSNSPECLFQVHGNTIKSMPIKGTVKIEQERERELAWEELKASPKDQGELYMISDLLRNDLAKLTKQAAFVKVKKNPLHVPGLVHQFSVVESKLNSRTNLADIIRSLFPGGSITGAPKKRVMQIINKIEKDKRGFYCGSTILLYKNIKTASINIRSIDVDFASNEITYGAGGGVTLESDSDSEFNELMAKLKSFLEVLC